MTRSFRYLNQFAYTFVLYAPSMAWHRILHYSQVNYNGWSCDGINIEDTWVAKSIDKFLIWIHRSFHTAISQRCHQNHSKHIPIVTQYVADFCFGSRTFASSRTRWITNYAFFRFSDCTWFRIFFTRKFCAWGPKQDRNVYFFHQHKLLDCNQTSGRGVLWARWIYFRCPF